MSSLTVINPKIPKRLNDINQEAKHLFPYYFIHNGLILPFDEMMWKEISGIHFMEIPDTLKIPELHEIDVVDDAPSQVIGFSSNAIYDALKDTKKKDILSFHVIDKFFLMNTITHDCELGIVSSIDYALDKLTPDTIRITKFRDEDSGYDFYAKLTQAMVEELRTKCITLNWSGYKIRMSRALIPNFKKTDTIGIYFKTTKDDCFNAIFEVTKESGLKIYHSYDFINF